MDSYDVVVIGGGLEGIAHALRAARNGARVALFEARAEFGGRLGQVAPFADGAPQPFAHLIWGVDPAAFRLLGLRPLELGMTPAPHLSVMTGEATPFTFPAEPALLRSRLSGAPDYEIERLERLRAMLARAAKIKAEVRRSAREVPRRRGARAEDDALAWTTALAGLTREQRRELLHIASASMTDFVGGFLREQQLRQAVMAPALFHQAMSPALRGSALGLLDAPPLSPVLGERFSMPLMLMADTDAIHRALMTQLHNRGVTFEIGSKVTHLNIDKGIATGIAFEDGRVVEAKQVISTLDAKATLLALADWDALPEGLARRTGELPLQGSLARIFLKIKDRPPDEARALFKGPVYFNIDAAEAAAQAWSLDHVPNRPPFEVTLQEAATPFAETDVSAFAQFVPRAPLGESWAPAQVSGLVDALKHELQKVWPGAIEKVDDWTVWLPDDLEREFGWSHGAASFLPGAGGVVSDYGLPEFAGGRSPIEGLTLARPSTLLMAREVAQK